MKKENLLRGARRTVLFVLIAVMTLVSNITNTRMLKDIQPYESVDRTVGLEAAERNRGVTTDGSGWFFSGGSTLIKVDFDNKTVLALNKKAVPSDAKGAKQIGGISYADGQVFAAIEDAEQPTIAVYSADTLENKASATLSGLTGSVAWAACDPQTGTLYTSAAGTVRELYVYDAKTLAFKETIALSENVEDIRGGEVYNGSLYLATNDATRAVYRVDPITGNTTLYFGRFTSTAKRGGTGEDITALERKDGTVFHALNTGALGIDANLRHYLPIADLPVPTPPNTYLKKYVLDKIAGGKYTIRTDTVNPDTGTHTLATVYCSGNDTAYEVVVSDLMSEELKQEYPLLTNIAAGSKIRLIVRNASTDPKVYLSLPIGYIDMQDLPSLDGAALSAEELKEMFREIGGVGDTLTEEANQLEYIEAKPTGSHMVCESYLSSDKSTTYHFYFTSAGLSSVKIVNTETGEILQEMFIQIDEGISDKNAFNPGLVKLDVETIMKLFNIIAD